MLREKIFFVKLTKDINESGKVQSEVKIKKSETGKTGNIKIETEKVIAVDPVGKKDFLSHRVNTDAVSEKNDFSMERSPDGKVLLASYTGSGRAVDVSYARKAGDTGTSGDSRGNGELSAGIFELIRNAIEKAKTYPVLARKMGLDGTVYIGFRISPQGEPQDIKIIKSSGVRILDAATMDIVKKAAPFPSVNAPVEVPVVFKLE
ncbi:MAG: energy transducer TonB [Nitrospirota bacterium]